ncbi:hypothetical protein P9112_012979 [Eukaryota sp. TZLM1-RC]
MTSIVNLFQQIQTLLTDSITASSSQYKDFSISLDISPSGIYNIDVQFVHSGKHIAHSLPKSQSVKYNNLTAVHNILSELIQTTPSTNSKLNSYHIKMISQKCHLILHLLNQEEAQLFKLPSASSLVFGLTLNQFSVSVKGSDHHLSCRPSKLGKVEGCIIEVLEVLVNIHNSNSNNLV